MTPPLRLEVFSSSVIEYERVELAVPFQSSKCRGRRGGVLFLKKRPGNCLPASGWGVKLRMRETEGRNGALTVRCPRSIATAERIKFSGESVQSLGLEEGNDSIFTVEFGRNDYFEVLIRWKK